MADANPSLPDDDSEDEREEALDIMMAGIGLVLASKPGGKTNPHRDRECASNALAMLEDSGFEIRRREAD